MQRAFHTNSERTSRNRRNTTGIAGERAKARANVGASVHMPVGERKRSSDLTFARLSIKTYALRERINREVTLDFRAPVHQYVVHSTELPSESIRTESC